MVRHHEGSADQQPLEVDCEEEKVVSVDNPQVAYALRFRAAGLAAELGHERVE
jgi:hypothetical protein